MHLNISHLKEMNLTHTLQMIVSGQSSPFFTDWTIEKVSDLIGLISERDIYCSLCSWELEDLRRYDKIISRSAVILSETSDKMRFSHRSSG